MQCNEMMDLSVPSVLICTELVLFLESHFL